MPGFLLIPLIDAAGRSLAALILPAITVSGPFGWTAVSAVSRVAWYMVPRRRSEILAVEKQHR